MEIERKFLLARLPENLPEGELIQQAYLALDPEVRVRRRGNQSFITIKEKGSLARQETEALVLSWVFEALWPLCELRVEKRRHIIDVGLRVLEIDVFQGSLTGLLMLEIEFPSTEEAIAFRLPSWITDAVEVTEDRRYKNQSLARYGIPAR